MAEEMSQADRRKGVRMTDQFGRRWFTVVDTGKYAGPCVPISPDGWAPPHPVFMPAQKYLRMDPQDDRRINVDHAQMYEDALAADRAWQDELERWALTMYEGGFAAAVEHPPLALLKMVGPRPPNPKVFLALVKGNKWALGLKQPNGELYPTPANAAALLPVLPEQEMVDPFADTTDEDGTPDAPPDVDDPFTEDEPVTETEPAKAKGMGKRVARPAASHAGVAP